MRRILPFLLTVLLLTTCLSQALSAAGALAGGPGGEPDLLIAHTSDIHAHYRPFKSRSGDSRGGLARISARLTSLREQYGERFLYIDSGDLFQGTPFYHFYRGALGMELLERMGCDVMALGNHELDDGSLNMLRNALGVSYPLLCANLSYDDGSPLLPASLTLKKAGIRVALLGLISEAMPELSAECADGRLLTRPPSTVLNEWLTSGQATGADLRIVVSHCGLGEDRGLAASSPAGNPHLILGGHSHSFLDEPVFLNDVCICHTGCYGYVLGVIECYRRPDGGWDFLQRLEPVDESWEEDRELAAVIERAAILVDREMQLVLTRLPEAFEARNKSGRPDPLGIYFAELIRRSAGADIGLQNTGGYRGFWPAGDLKREQLFEMLPFDNHVVRLEFSGRELQTVFDFLASSHGGGHFGQISGASYVIEAGQARDVRIGGRPLDPDRSYSLATLDFLYGGGDGYDCLAADGSPSKQDDFARDLVERDLSSGHVPRPGDYPANFEVR